ncbi:MAG: TlyA family RNA methyltransferase [Bacillota bacterium]|nr:TlyA family RNA methyltransferase [Bacillota bacterium]
MGPAPPKGRRLDAELVERGLYPSRQKAQAAILAGEVFLNGQRALKPSQKVEPGDAVELRPRQKAFVSRGGLKLDHALETFGIPVAGKVCLDLGASTGGFTDALLQRGARKVYAVDVAYGRLDVRLREDPRVVVLERVNARYLDRPLVPEPVEFLSADLSFISLEKVLPAVVALLSAEAQGILLVKPQFEAGRGQVGKGGVVRSPEVHGAILARFWETLPSLGLYPRDVTPSPILGAKKGNVEYLLWVSKVPPAGPAEKIQAALTKSLDIAAHRRL